MKLVLPRQLIKISLKRRRLCAQPVHYARQHSDFFSIKRLFKLCLDRQSQRHNLIVEFASNGSQRKMMRAAIGFIRRAAQSIRDRPTLLTRD